MCAVGLLGTKRKYYVSCLLAKVPWTGWKRLEKGIGWKRLLNNTKVSVCKLIGPW